MTVHANVITLPGLVAGASLASAQFRAVEVNSTGQVTQVNATSDLAIGVLQNNPASGEEAEVAVGGLAKWQAGTSVGWSNGIAVGYNTTGQAVPLAANGTNDNRPILGRFHHLPGQTSVAANQIVSVQLLPGAQRL